MTPSPVAESLRAFGPSTLAVRAVGEVLGTLASDPLPAYRAPEDALGVVAPESAARLAARAEVLADDALSRRIVAVGTAVDGADRAVARALARTPSAGDTLAPQAEDAALKLLVLGWLASVTRGLVPLPSGAALLRVWAAVDVALPLGGADLSRMLGEQRSAAAIRLVALCGEEGMEGMHTGTDGLLAAAQREVDAAAARTEALALALAPFVPGLMASDRDAAARIALGADRLPLYKWLTARIAAEHAVARAAAELAP